MILQGNTEKNPNTLLMSPELLDTQSLMPISDSDRENLKKDIELNGMRHPIIVYRKEKDYFIIAGWNRRQIAVELNIPIVEVQIMEGTADEYKSFVITENLSRRHLTTDQKRELIKYLLRANPEQSNLSISKKAGLSDKTVNSVRKELETTSEIPTLKDRKGTDGKIRKSVIVRKIHKSSEKPNKPLNVNPDNFIDSIRDYLKNQIMIIENENPGKKSNSYRIKIDARKDAFNEVLEFIDKRL